MLLSGVCRCYHPGGCNLEGTVREPYNPSRSLRHPGTWAWELPRTKSCSDVIEYYRAYRSPNIARTISRELIPTTCPRRSRMPRTSLCSCAIAFSICTEDFAICSARLSRVTVPLSVLPRFPLPFSFFSFFFPFLSPFFFPSGLCSLFLLLPMLLRQRGN